MRIGKAGSYSDHDLVPTPDNANFVSLYRFVGDGQMYQKDSNGISTVIGGGGVQSVSGTNVDNFDPLNPVIVGPNYFEIKVKLQNSADLENAGSAPINLNIPIIGYGDIIEVVSASGRFIKGAGLMTFSNISLIQSGADREQAKLATIDVSQPESFKRFQIQPSSGAEINQLKIGIPLLMQLDSDSPAGTGAGASITLFIAYRILN